MDSNEGSSKQLNALIVQPLCCSLLQNIKYGVGVVQIMQNIYIETCSNASPIYQSLFYYIKKIYTDLFDINVVS